MLFRLLHKLPPPAGNYVNIADRRLSTGNY
jgi:hypothetical protein